MVADIHWDKNQGKYIPKLDLPISLTEAKSIAMSLGVEKLWLREITEDSDDT